MGNGEIWITCEIWREIVKNRFPCNNNFENYRRLKNKYEKMRKLSQWMYFKERCDGGPQNQSFWKTVKPFLSTKCKNENKIFLRENDPIAVTDIFKTYFVNIADGIGNDIDGKIPPDYENGESLINMISKYDSHPSILAIKRARQQCCPFQFSEVMYDDVNLWIWILKNMVMTTFPANFWKLVLFLLLVLYAN